MEMLIFWGPLLIIFFGMIILGLVKHENNKLFAISIAWISMIAAAVLLYYVSCLLFSLPDNMQDYASDIIAGFTISLFFLPIVMCVIFYIRSIRKKDRNDGFLAAALAWGLFPVFAWLYVWGITAILGGDPCP